MSFAGRLLEWLLAPLLFLWLLSVGITFLAARETVDTALDDQLNLAANLIYEEWRDLAAETAQLGMVSRVFPSPSVRRILNNDRAYPIRFLITDSKARVLAGDDEMSPLLRAAEGELQKFDTAQRDPGNGINTVADDDFVRAVRFYIDVGGERQNLAVSQSRSRQDRLLRTILFYEAIPQSFVLLIAIFLVWYGLAYVVRPMRTLKSHLDSRGGDNLVALPVQLAPKELEPLIESINSLMARLNTSLAAQRRFIANAAHQLRTPLAALRAHSELLKRANDTQHRNYAADQLLATSSRASRLANQLLSMARAESSGTTAQFDRVELNQLCRDVAQEILPLALDRHIEFAFDACETPLAVRGDATLLTELTHNLIDNALKYTPQHGTVLLALYANPVRIVVEDSGPGISEDERERVFAPFARIARFEAGSDHAIGGTGLGLAIVEEVARSHNAVVKIDKSRWGGAMFTVTFTAS
jgi:two-component system, OmpR family, sensor histidine kinase TctE